MIIKVTIKGVMFSSVKHFGFKSKMCTERDVWEPLLDIRGT